MRKMTDMVSMRAAGCVGTLQMPFVAMPFDWHVLSTLTSTLPKTNIDPGPMAPWKIVFLYQPVVFRVHGIVFQIVNTQRGFPESQGGLIHDFQGECSALCLNVCSSWAPKTQDQSKYLAKPLSSLLGVHPRISSESIWHTFLVSANFAFHPSLLGDLFNHSSQL